MGYEVFISHSSIDKNIADAVTAALEQAKIRCWIAPRDILPGESWGGSIVDAIEASQVMVIVFSANSNDSKQVMREVERAVQKDVVVVPFRVEAVEPSKDMEYFLSSTHWLDAVTPEMDSHLQELVNTVQVLLNKNNGDGKGFVPPVKTVQPAAPIAAVPTGSKRSFFKPLLGIAAIAVLALGAFFFMGGDSDSPVNNASSASNSAKSSTKKSVAAKDLGERAVGSIKLKLPKQAIAAEMLNVEWSGKSAANDRLIIAKADSQDSVHLYYSAAGESKQTELQLPANPGDYEVRFMNMANRKIIAREKIEIQKPVVGLEVVNKPLPGGNIQVSWTAPNNKNDYVAIAELGSAGKVYQTYSYTKAGSPTTIRVPDVPGDYELRYISHREAAIWAAQKITVPAPVVSIELPQQVVAGSAVEVTWQGPANKNDYVCVSEVGARAGKYETYSYVRDNRDLIIKIPEQAGDFEARYISSLSKQIWATQKVTVTAPEVSVVAPQSAQAGQLLSIEWQGPANKNDFLAIAEAGTEGKKYINYVYVRAGKKLKLLMPDTPGDYVLRYVSAAKRHIWAEVPVTIAARDISLEVPASISVGEKISVSWPQTGHGNEFVAIYPKEGETSKYASYARTANKKKTQLRALKEPGEYEVRYVSGKEKLVWAVSPITVK